MDYEIKNKSWLSICHSHVVKSGIKLSVIYELKTYSKKLFNELKNINKIVLSSSKVYRRPSYN